MERPGKFVMPLGKHRGRTLDQIGHTDEGLKYIDWLVGQEWVNGRTREALEAFLQQPAVARDLDRILEDED